tara:strand:+ start:1709 stop:2254 length:546 start_codon:yes stop_codon:yes gene_type:complete
MKRFTFVSLILLISLYAFPSSFSAKSIKAPEWVISEWINGSGISLRALQGTVVVVEFFQLWCPGCNKFSIPLMKQWNQTFHSEINAGKLKILSIHTVFEGHDYQTPERLKNFVKEKSIHHLVGVDHHNPGEHLPETMKRYNTMGTPEVAIIDKKGAIKMQKFGGFDTEKAERLIRYLLASD